MNARRIGAIVEREWFEVRRNKMILITMALLPLLLVAITLVVTVLLERTPVSEMKLRGFVAPPGLGGLTAKQAFIAVMADQWLLYLLLIPSALPVTIAAYSVIGEKALRTLEPLLATPITTAELLIGKTVAALTPAVLLGWLAYAIAVIGLYFVSGPSLLAQAVRPLWLLGMGVLSPLLALLATLLALLTSSRVNDVRAAQVIAALVVVPVVGGAAAMVSGKILLNLRLLLGAIAVLALLDAALLWATIRVFRRETILTRWK
jgi:ABC-2 type transport system permease protein